MLDINDDYTGCSLEDVAMAVASMPSGSDDQRLAIAAFYRRAPAIEPPPGMGHNMPPLDELLDEELAPWRRQHDEFMATARDIRIVDEETASKATDVAKKMSDWVAAIEASRKAFEEPYARALANIRLGFGALQTDITKAWRGEDNRGGVRALLTAWDDKKRAASVAARIAADAERRVAEERAELAQRRVEQLPPSGLGVAAAEREAQRAREAAADAAARAEAAQHVPTRGQLGTLSRRRVIRHTIADLKAAVAWALGDPAMSGALTDALGVAIQKYLNSYGVEVVSKGALKIPGVEIRIEYGDTNVRR